MFPRIGRPFRAAGATGFSPTGSREQQRKVVGIEDPFGFACRLMLGWSEMVRLRAEDLENGELILRPDEDAKRTRGGGRIKGRKIRRVPISSGLAREIKQHVGKLTPFKADGDSAFILAVRRRSGVSDFGSHDLRHTFAVNHIVAGVNIRVLQLLLGHASIATTERYSKITQDLVREDARKVMGWNPGA